MEWLCPRNYVVIASHESIVVVPIVNGIMMDLVKYNLVSVIIEMG